MQKDLPPPEPSGQGAIVEKKGITPTILRHIGICRDCGAEVPVQTWHSYDCKCTSCGRPKNEWFTD